jgi:hypothetical protein
MPFHLSPPRTEIFLASVTLAIIALVGRVLISFDIPAPVFPTGGFVLLAIAYVLILAGNVFKGM